MQPNTKTVTAELEATSRAILAAADAHVQDAMAKTHWRRRGGFLQRLTRAAGPPEPRRDHP